MVSGGEQRQDHLAAGVIRIGHKQAWTLGDISDFKKYGHQFVKKCSAVAVGKDEAFTDAGHNRHGETLPGNPVYQEGNGLKRVSHDVGGL